MNAHEVRQKYLAFMQAHGHAIVPRANIVPTEDPTTLFTGSGMQPMVPYLLGETHPQGVRLADSQIVYRSVDIEEVGDNSHNTMFEMLGNWSLGDYFKEEQIRWCAVAKQEQDHSIEQFIRLVWEPLIPLGFKFTTEKRADGTQLHCTACPIHELSKVIGGAEWLTLLECNKDLHNVQGFNPKIGFTRTKTLIKGDSHCNHFYYEKTEAV